MSLFLFEGVKPKGDAMLLGILLSDSKFYAGNPSRLEAAAAIRTQEYVCRSELEAGNLQERCTRHIVFPTFFAASVDSIIANERGGVSFRCWFVWTTGEKT